MRKYKQPSTEPKFFSDFNLEEAAQMIAALRRTDPKQRFETFAVVMKLLVEGQIDE